ncbi:hypothetical protein TNCV_1050841 [Trichonephila clavipes]|nr:hypothetical protein TNCV_1050841 [Trichonephila clavipes]
MVRLGNTRPLPWHSSIGSIYTRKKLHPGVAPLTTESNKGGSVPVIGQNQARRLPGVHPEHSATASGLPTPVSPLPPTPVASPSHEPFQDVSMIYEFLPPMEYLPLKDLLSVDSRPPFASMPP